VRKTGRSNWNRPKKSEKISKVRPVATVLTKKAYKARFKERKGEGFHAALAMMKAGKSVAEMEDSMLGKCTSSA